VGLLDIVRRYKLHCAATRQKICPQHHHIECQFSGSCDFGALSAIIMALPSISNFRIDQHRFADLHGSSPIHRAMITAIGESAKAHPPNRLAGAIRDQVTRHIDTVFAIVIE
jgi:hypothetical protein